MIPASAGGNVLKFIPTNNALVLGVVLLLVAGTLWFLEVISLPAALLINGLSVTYGVILHKQARKGVAAKAAYQTRLREVEHELERMRRGVNKDPLTGLHSRTYIRDRLEEIIEISIKRKSACAVLYLDLDFFKELNEALGQGFGNKLLMHVGRRLRAVVKKGDLLGYYGGDEYLVVLPKINNMVGAELVARRIISALSKPFKLDGQQVSVSASIGIALGPADGGDCETLIGRAETALKSSKAKGRKVYSFYSQQLNQQAAERLKIDQLLRGALERNELSIRYQAIVAEQGTKLKGFEALIRWETPEIGPVSPSVFIPIAEQIGLISELGTWVLREAVLQAKLWQVKYQRPVLMSVNVSPRQFQDKSILPAVKSVISQTGIPPSTLQLEVTEGLFLSASDQILDSIDVLKQSGIRLALDDFGTGFSSLSYLNRLPFDVLKIDKSFVDGIVSNERDRKMITAIIAIGHGLGMEIVVEGVEAVQQVYQLRELRADSLQGYYYSKPLPAQEAESRFLKRASIMEMNENIWDHL